MECRHVREGLLDLLEGSIGPEQRIPVEEHLARCDACRAELRMLERGRNALVASLEEPVPSGRYLTQERLARLLGAFEARRRASRIITLPRLVVTAAAAAILVSCFFMYQHLRPKPAGVGQPRMAERSEVATLSPGWANMVALTSPSDERRLDIVFSYTKTSAVSVVPSAQVRPANLIRATSPGVRVPAWNAFYDCEEAGCWW